MLRQGQREGKVNAYAREQVRRAREERGLSQEEVGKQMYRTGSALGDIERGRVKLDVEDLVGLAIILEKPLSYFFRGVVIGAEEKDLSPKEKELVYFFRQLQHEALENVALNQVKALAESAIKADIEATVREALQSREKKK